MIDEYSPNGTGWARFSDDRRMRYRLSRKLRDVAAPMNDDEKAAINRVVFVMLNPSTADAFKLDPTVQKCCKFATRWGADVLEVVNLFAMRSTDPQGLYNTPIDQLGRDWTNDGEIFAACDGAARVIAAWGNHGRFAGRGDLVRSRLAQRDITLHHLGLTKEDQPLHPLARGKAFIPLDREPVVWG